jgi:hypothetical protein
VSTCIRPVVEGPLYPDLFDGETPILKLAVARCLVCGASDDELCGHPMHRCYWWIVDWKRRIGICVGCQDTDAAWEHITTADRLWNLYERATDEGQGNAAR